MGFSLSESDPWDPSATAGKLCFQESLLQQRNINLFKTKATENYSHTLCSDSEEQGMGSGTETQGREKCLNLTPNLLYRRAVLEPLWAGDFQGTALNVWTSGIWCWKSILPSNIALSTQAAGGHLASTMQYFGKHVTVMKKDTSAEFSHVSVLVEQLFPSWSIFLWFPFFLFNVFMGTVLGFDISFVCGLIYFGRMAEVFDAIMSYWEKEA